MAMEPDISGSRRAQTFSSNHPDSCEPCRHSPWTDYLPEQLRAVNCHLTKGQAHKEAKMAILGLNKATATKDRLATCTVTRDYFPQVCLAGRGATRGWRKGGQGSLAQGPKNWLLNGFKKEVASDLNIRGFAQVSKQWPWLLQGFKVRASEGGFSWVSPTNIVSSWGIKLSGL